VKDSESKRNGLRENGRYVNRKRRGEGEREREDGWEKGERKILKMREGY
jgi:hypothetical protein